MKKIIFENKNYKIGKRLVCFGAALLSLCCLSGCFLKTGESSKELSNSSAQATEHKMNDLVVVGDLECKVNSAYNTKKLGTLDNPTENNYVVLNIYLKNNATSEKTLTSSNFTYYRGQSSYTPSTQSIYLTGGTPFCVIETIGSGIIKTLDFVFEIPSNFLSTDYIVIKNGLKSEKIYLK